MLTTLLTLPKHARQKLQVFTSDSTLFPVNYLKFCSKKGALVKESKYVVDFDHGFGIRKLHDVLDSVLIGHTQRLRLVGVGYRAEPVPNDTTKLHRKLGFCHKVYIKTIQIHCLIRGTAVAGRHKASVLHVSGIEKGVVQHISKVVTRIREPIPYTARGIHFVTTHGVSKRVKETQYKLAHLKPGKRTKQ